MNRTYDVFVDNGLYILSYYLTKPLEEITLQDIEDNLEMMCDIVEDTLNTEKYKNLKSMVLFNSALSNPGLIKKNTRLSTMLKDFLNEKGNDYCSICGENHANIHLDLKGRSYLFNKPSATFFNFTNNLHSVNICPYCLVLGVYSVINCRVNNTVYIYNSSDDEFMQEFTTFRQEENIKDVMMNPEKPKTNKNRIETILEMIDYNLTFDYDIEIVRFNNGKTEEQLENENISSEIVNIIRNMRNKNLLNEFRSLNLSNLLINNKLQNYFNYIVDKEYNLKCTQELFDFLNKEVGNLDTETLDLIESICKKLNDINLDTEKYRKKLRGSIKLNGFLDFIMEISELYLEKTNQKLFNANEYLILSDYKKFKHIKNMMLINLI